MRRLLATALALLLAFVPAAEASYDPVSSGTTRISLDRGFLALLKQNEVKLSATEGATLRAGVVTFAVSGGKLDPAAAKGTVEHAGALVLRKGGRSLPFTALQLKTTSKRTPFSVKVGGGQLKLATARRLDVSRQGFGSKVKVSSLALSAKVATRLGKKLALRGVFKAGQPLGSSLTRADPLTVALRGTGKVSFELAPPIAAKLASLFVAMNPIFPAEHPNVFTLSIFAGTLAPDGSQGVLETSGAFELLQLGGGQVFWREPALDFAAKSLAAEAEVDPSPPYGGKLGPVPLASLTTATVSADPAARTIAVSGAQLALSAKMAQTLNEVFAAPLGKSGVFAAGEALGTVAFGAQGQ